MSDSMIKETGRVVAVEGDSVWVEIERRSACSQCSIGAGCGTSVLARWFGRRSNCIRVPNHFSLKQGDTAEVGISDQAFLKAVLLAYLLPVMSMVASALLAAGLGATDGVAALSAAGGLAVGLLLLRGISHRAEGLQPQIQLTRHLPISKH